MRMTIEEVIEAVKSVVARHGKTSRAKAEDRCVSLLVYANDEAQYFGVTMLAQKDLREPHWVAHAADRLGGGLDIFSPLEVQTPEDVVEALLSMIENRHPCLGPTIIVPADMGEHVVFVRPGHHRQRFILPRVRTVDGQPVPVRVVESEVVEWTRDFRVSIDC